MNQLRNLLSTINNDFSTIENAIQEIENGTWNLQSCDEATISLRRLKMVIYMPKLIQMALDANFKAEQRRITLNQNIKTTTIQTTSGVDISIKLNEPTPPYLPDETAVYHSGRTNRSYQKISEDVTSLDFRSQYPRKSVTSKIKIDPNSKVATSLKRDPDDLDFRGNEPNIDY
jgi:hypothetical protein